MNVLKRHINKWMVVRLAIALIFIVSGAEKLLSPVGNFVVSLGGINCRGLFALRALDRFLCDDNRPDVLGVYLFCRAGAFEAFAAD